MDATHALAENLKAIRKHRKMSLADFANALGIAKSTLQQIEHGCPPNLATVEQISKQLKIPVQALLSADFAAHADLISLLLGLYNWFFQLPPAVQPEFAAWVHTQLDSLLQFSRAIPS